MQTRAESEVAVGPAYVSTGRLPTPEQVRTLVAEAYERYKSSGDGQNSQVYPALARVPNELFGVCVVGTRGNVYAVGDADYEFTIMSVSKPFVFALVCQAVGVEEVRQRIGVNATGLAFNSLAAIEQSPDGRTNPMVNAGAIATTSLVPGATLEAHWQFIHDGLSRFAGRTLPLNEEVYASASETNFRNQGIARLLQSYGRIYMDPAEATDLYTKQCSLNVSAKDLGVMGATLADGGVNPLTKERVVDAAVCHYALAVMVIMVISPTTIVMLAAQGLAGLAGAALVPTLVALIAGHYKGTQQAEALGWLGSARAMAGVLAFLIIGTLERFVSWRVAFGLLIVHAAAILLLSFKLKAAQARPEVKIDVLGVILAAVGIILIAFGFNNVRSWGILLARAAAPFDVLGLSPAPVMIVVGIVLVSAFLAWTRTREADRKTPLLALAVLDSPQERAAVMAMFTIVAMEAAINFTVPLYIQIVQGRSAFQTAIAMMPFNLTVFFTAILIVRLYHRFTPRQIARYAFLLVTAGALWLAFVVRNDWSTVPVLLGLVTVGVGQGALVTLLFNVLVTASPRELAADVGSLRGVTNNLAASVGTAVMGALVVGLLSAAVMRSLTATPIITPELQAQVDLDNINFLSNDRLEERLKSTTATPEQVAEAVHINTEARLRALKLAFFILAGVALLAVFPSGRLPDYRPGEVPSGPPQGIAERDERRSA